MKKLNKKFVFAVLLVVLFALVLVVGIASKNQTEKEAQKEEYLIPRETSRDTWRRRLEVNDSNEKNVIQNIYDGYKIRLSEEWNYNNTADPIGGFIAYKLKDGVDTEIFRGLEDGVVLSIQTIDNDKKMSAVDWLARTSEPANYLLDGLIFEKINHPNETGVYISRHKVFAIEVGENAEHTHAETITENPSGDFLENSSKVDYVFAGGGKIYIVSCASMAEAYVAMVYSCEQQIQTFDILD